MEIVRCGGVEEEKIIFATAALVNFDCCYYLTKSSHALSVGITLLFVKVSRCRTDSEMGWEWEVWVVVGWVERWRCVR